MNNYKFSFTGRQTGAIGIFYSIQDTYKAQNLAQAMFMLYTDYEHISYLIAKENGRTIPTDNIKLENCEVPKRSKNPVTGSYLLTRSNTPT